MDAMDTNIYRTPELKGLIKKIAEHDSVKPKFSPTDFNGLDLKATEKSGFGTLKIDSHTTNLWKEGALQDLKTSPAKPGSKEYENAFRKAYAGKIYNYVQTTGKPVEIKVGGKTFLIKPEKKIEKGKEQEESKGYNPRNDGYNKESDKESSKKTWGWGSSTGSGNEPKKNHPLSTFG